MKTALRSALQFFVACLATSPLLARAQATASGPPDTSADRSSLPAGGAMRLEVHARNGAIRADASAHDRLEVSVARSGKDASEFRLVVRRDGDTLVACMLQRDEPDAACKPGGPVHGARRELEARTDLVVTVPRALAATRLRTMNGTVTGRLTSAEATATTMNGDVDLTSSGSIVAETMNGNVRARASSGKAVKASSKNGRVEVFLPADEDADVDATTMRGTVQSEFGPVPPPQLRPMHAASFRLGRGGVSVALSTMNGDIYVRRAAPPS